MSIQLQVVMYSIFYEGGPDHEEIAGAKRKAPANGAQGGSLRLMKSPASPTVNKISFRELDKFRRRLSRWDHGYLCSWPWPMVRDQK